jgi:Peptidase family M1 domain
MKRRKAGVPQVSPLRPGRKRPLAIAIAVLVGSSALLSAPVCTASTPAVEQQEQPRQKQIPANSSYGQTIFSRSASGASNTAQATPAGHGATPSPVKAPSATALVTDAERTALTYTSYDFEVHLEPSKQSLDVQARMVARNDSGQPLRRIALQLSSSLRWYSIRVNGRSAKFQTETVDSDIDHTGRLTEAVITLQQPLAAGTEVHLDTIYSGTITPSAERLLRLGAPANIAASSEWDGVGEKFTALRGFGNAIWFPISTAPVLLGQGPQMFDSIGKWKLRESNATVKMHVLVEYMDAEPNVAFLNGYVVKPDGPANEHAATQASETGESPDGTSSSSANSPAVNSANNGVLQVASFALPPTTLGFSPLSFFVMDAARARFPGLDIYTPDAADAAVQTYKAIVNADRPLIQQWLGPRPKRPVVLVDLPDSHDLPFEERNLLFLPMSADATSDTAGPVMAHMLSHSYFVSWRPWMNEGVAQFMTLLWIDERAGRNTAIEQMDSRRAALALAETSDPGVDPGQSLVEAWSDIFYRDKAADVLWMLRDIAGDGPLASALQAYDSAKDHEPSYFQTLLQKTSGKDLEWFFDDWIYRDRGLPDLHIASAYRRKLLTKNDATGNYLVSVDVRNDSFCSAEVPVTVQSPLTSQTKRLLVPAHGSDTVRMLMETEPTQVTVNDGSVPEVRTSHHERSIAPAQ